MKDYETDKWCSQISCKYFNDKMELNCSYDTDNSRCVHDELFGKKEPDINQEMLEALIKNYKCICTDCMIHESLCHECETKNEIKNIIEKATGMKIEEVIK